MVVSKRACVDSGPENVYASEMMWTIHARQESKKQCVSCVE